MTVQTNPPPGTSAEMTGHPGGQTAPGVRADASYQVRSYRYLRIGIVGLLLALGAAVIYQRIQPHCGLGSVSAYFYTPVRSVFVAGLVGLGVGMLALRGLNLAEDIFLNLGGIFAFLVAFVPTGGGSGACQDPDTRVSGSVQDNVTALLIVGFAALAVAFALLVAGWKTHQKAYRRWALAEAVAALLLWAATLIAVTCYLSWMLRYVHSIAAISLAACIIAVAGANAYRLKAARAGLLYAWIAAGMLVISVLLLVLAVSSVITVFWLEISVAAMFIVFWTAQTVQLETEGATR